MSVHDDLELARRHPIAAGVTLALTFAFGATVPHLFDGGWWTTTAVSVLVVTSVWLCLAAVVSHHHRRQEEEA